TLHTPNTKHQTPNTKHQTPNTKHQTPNTKHQTPEPKTHTPNPKPSTLHPPPGVWHTAAVTEYGQVVTWGTGQVGQVSVSTHPSSVAVTLRSSFEVPGS
ncbi:hypothetical protein T484DRAFT_1650535, partial [Baffinella frigidus]